MKRIITLAFALAALTMAGCGVNSTPSSDTTGDKAPASQPDKTPDAFDPGLLSQAEGEITDQLEGLADGGNIDATVTDASAHCVADDERTFTCTGHLEATSNGFCFSIQGEERGQVIDGVESWKATHTDEPVEVPC